MSRFEEKLAHMLEVALDADQPPEVRWAAADHLVGSAEGIKRVCEVFGHQPSEPTSNSVWDGLAFCGQVAEINGEWAAIDMDGRFISEGHDSEAAARDAVLESVRVPA